MSIFSNQALKNEHALITGATGGIGAATAKTLAGMGAAVTITGRNEEKLENVAENIRSTHPDANICKQLADLGKDSDRETLVEQAEKACGPITLLVNNAGIAGGSTVDELTKEKLESIMDINYTSTVLLTQLVYKKMLKKKRGAIVNVSSLSGLRGTHGNTAYAGSKFALIGFTQSMAVEAIEHGIRVNAVCPGWVDTAMGQQSVENKAARTNTSVKDLLQSSVPSGRMSEPEEVANTIAFLLTDAAANIVGESVKISGGTVMR
ncbi:SDR family NAD(P)-dependent oxidoreductase [Virgibacillus halodenitrificans]|uniref:SDR family NAD(P)-dependent oxidoreductase n=1 Tax=Virgibacillus halodenitrificans TaxID=1482 RepID=UPI000EF4D720|nr:SDR family oxidoreductase [Virgibacillus halodenitrificans]MYL56716.1 SDR family NAD(P)-dependent oxidoreductase [Virgibacillus halodenitrificans]